MLAKPAMRSENTKTHFLTVLADKCRNVGRALYMASTACVPRAVMFSCIGANPPQQNKTQPTRGKAHAQTLAWNFNVSRNPECTQSAFELMRKRPRSTYNNVSNEKHDTRRVIACAIPGKNDNAASDQGWSTPAYLLKKCQYPRFVSCAYYMEYIHDIHTGRTNELRSATSHLPTGATRTDTPCKSQLLWQPVAYDQADSLEAS